MLDLLQLGPKDKLLEIGTGSGSQTAAFAATGAEVHSVELEPWLSEITEDGCTNVYLHQGDGKIGLEQEAPFTAIVATCGVLGIPQEWISQLAVNGRLIAPVGTESAQKLIKFIKLADGSVIPVKTGAYVRFQMLRCLPNDKRNTAKHFDQVLEVG